MAATINLPRAVEARDPVTLKPLDEVVWCAWLEKNRLAEANAAVTRMNAVKWTCIAVSACSVPLFREMGPYRIVVEFVLAVGGIISVAQSIQKRSYVLAAAFVAVVALFNPVIRLAMLAGAAGPPLVLAAAIIFALSIADRGHLPEASSVPEAMRKLTL
jgi:hypothetical protein